MNEPSTTRKVKPLTPAETQELAQIEAEIRPHINTFHLVGTRLMEIRDKKLYREQYSSFEAYLDERWDLSKSQAYRIIRATKAAAALPPGSPQPESVRGALGICNPPRSRSEPDEDEESEEEAVADLDADPIVARAKTNGHIPADAVVEVIEPEASDEPEPDPEPAEQTDEEWLDTLPVRSRIIEDARPMFDAEALAYRAMTKARESYQAVSCRVTASLKRDVNKAIGPWASKHALHFKIQHPEHWKVCSDCKGRQVHPFLKTICPSCSGFCYHV